MSKQNAVWKTRKPPPKSVLKALAMFPAPIRSILYNRGVTDENKAIIYTALLFTATHIFYLPFIGFGIYYIFVFIMALILSVLRVKFDQLSCAILHGGIVFILIIFV